MASSNTHSEMAPVDECDALFTAALRDDAFRLAIKHGWAATTATVAAAGLTYVTKA